MWFLRKKKIYRAEPESAKPKVIGLISTSKSTGLTHFAFMLYCYLKDFHRKKVAFITYDEDIIAFSRHSEDENVQRDVYYHLSYSEIMSFKELEIHYILVDFGCQLPEFREDFLRSDIRFLMGSLSLWQRESFLNYLFHENGQVLRGLHLIYHFGESRSAARIQKITGFLPKRVPDCETPFYLTRDSVKELLAFDEVLEL